MGTCLKIKKVAPYLDTGFNCLVCLNQFSNAIQILNLDNCAKMHGFSLPQIQREESKDER